MQLVFNVFTIFSKSNLIFFNILSQCQGYSTELTYFR
jgi:hypothetical protein